VPAAGEVSYHKDSARYFIAVASWHVEQGRKRGYIPVSKKLENPQNFMLKPVSPQMLRKTDSGDILNNQPRREDPAGQ